MRLREGLPSLRKRRVVEALRRSVGTCRRADFRVVHYSIQRDHLHLIVESAGKDALARGMKSLGTRVARTVNQAPPVRLDEASSGRWFDGWRQRPQVALDTTCCEVSRPRSWLLSIGWRRQGLIDLAEVPG